MGYERKKSTWEHVSKALQDDEKVKEALLANAESFGIVAAMILAIACDLMCQDVGMVF